MKTNIPDFMVSASDPNIFEVKRMLNEMPNSYTDYDLTFNGKEYYGIRNNKPHSLSRLDVLHPSVNIITGTEAIKLLKGERAEPKKYKCNKCGQEALITGTPMMCMLPCSYRTSGICGGALLPIDEPEQEWQPKVGDMVCGLPTSNQGKPVHDEITGMYVGKDARQIDVINCDYQYFGVVNLRPIQPPTVREQLKEYIKSRTSVPLSEFELDRIIEIVKNN